MIYLTCMVNKLNLVSKSCFGSLLIIFLSIRSSQLKLHIEDPKVHLSFQFLFTVLLCNVRVQNLLVISE